MPLSLERINKGYRAALDRGVDKYAADKRRIELQAQFAIEQGKDPQKVQQRLNDLTTRLSVDKGRAPKSKLQAAGETVTAGLVGTAEGLQRGVQNVELLARDIFGDEEKTAARREEIQRQRQQLEGTPLGQLAAESPKARIAGQVVGQLATDVAAGAVPAGKAAGAVGKGIAKVAPRLAARGGMVAQGAAQGAGIGALQDPGEELGPEATSPWGSRLRQAAVSGAVAGGIGAGLAGAGSAVRGASRAVLGPNKNLPGVTVGEITGNKAIQGVEDALSRLPVVGMRKAAEKSKMNISSKINDLKATISTQADDLPGMQARAFNELAENVKTPVNTNKVRKSLMSLSDKYAKDATPGSEAISREIAKISSKIPQGKDSFANMHSLRAKLDDTLFKESGDLASTKFAKNAGMEIRKIIENELKTTAGKAGRAKDYAAAKMMTQELKAYQEVDDLLRASVPEEGALDVRSFIKNLDKVVSKVEKGQKFSAPMARESFKDTFKGLKTLVSNARLGTNQLKNVNKGITIGQGVLTGAAGVIGTSMGLPLQKLLLPVAGGAAGLSRVLSSPTTVKALQKLSKTSVKSKAGKELIEKLTAVLGSQLTNQEELEQ